jgi:hypothetical protein
VTNNCAIFDPRTTRAVHIVGIAPDRPFRIGCPSGWVAETITLRPGERREHELVLRVPGELVVMGPKDTSPRGWRFTVRPSAHDEWFDPQGYDDGAVPDSIGAFWLPAGEWQWRLRRTGAAEIERTGTIAVPARGKVTLEVP